MYKLNLKDHCEVMKLCIITVGVVTKASRWYVLKRWSTAGRLLPSTPQCRLAPQKAQDFGDLLPLAVGGGNNMECCPQAFIENVYFLLQGSKKLGIGTEAYEGLTVQKARGSVKRSYV